MRYGILLLVLFLGLSFQPAFGQKIKCKEISREVAKKDVKKGRAMLILAGGIRAVIVKNQGEFEGKYKVSYKDYGCVLPDDISCLEAYNKEVFAYLDKKYNKKWRKEVAPEVIGVRNLK